MGCDIHIYAEAQNKDGAWNKIGACFPCCYADTDEPPLDFLDEDDGEVWTLNEHFTDQPYGGRNYNLFAWLADVRNGRGFAGVDTGDRIEPLSAPRGLPPGISKALQKESDDWGCDGHSHSWFLLSEILDADTSATITHRGVVSLAEFAEFKRSGNPPSWAGAAWGERVRMVSNDEMQKLLESPPDDGLSYHTQIEWQQPLTEPLAAFMEAMRSLSRFGTDTVRIVFWFDN